MKKILAAFDGLKYSIATQDHAIAVAKKNNGFLVGVFLDDLLYHSYSIYDLLSEDGGGIETKRKHLETKDVKHRGSCGRDYRPLTEQIEEEEKVRSGRS